MNDSKHTHQCDCVNQELKEIAHQKAVIAELVEAGKIALAGLNTYEPGVANQYMEEARIKLKQAISKATPLTEGEKK